MSKELEIVGKIGQFLTAADQTASPQLQELAEEYAAACRDVNAMLQKCDEFLSKDMWFEAIHLAETPPPVFDRYEALQIQNVDEWHEICLTYG